MPLVVTIALRLPAAGAVERFTVSSVAVAVFTVPTAPESNTTVLFAAVVSNPKPTISTCEALALSCALAFAVTTGETPATTTFEPLLIELVLTEALSKPASVGLFARVTVSDVADAVVTEPVAPLSNVTTLLAAVGSKP